MDDNERLGATEPLLRLRRLRLERGSNSGPLIEKMKRSTRNPSNRNGLIQMIRMDNSAGQKRVYNYIHLSQNCKNDKYL